MPVSCRARTLVRGSRGVWATAFVFSCLWGIAASQHGAACSKMSDCTDSKASLCAIYWRDISYRSNTLTQDVTSPLDPSAGAFNGYCVECQSDCDCGVNQYCGVDRGQALVIPAGIKSANDPTRNGITREDKLYSELYGKSFAGMPIRSRCYNYEVSGSLCNPATNLQSQVYSVPVQQTRVRDGLAEKVLRTPAFWPASEEGRFCGKILTFAPAFYEQETAGALAAEIPWTTKADSDQKSTGNFYNSPARCPKAVAYKDAAYTCNTCSVGTTCNIDGSFPQTVRNPLCNSTVSSQVISVPRRFEVQEPCGFPEYDAAASPGATAAGFRFKSPSIDWTGHCNNGRCDICKETGDPADDRCKATGGIRQRCLNGQWVAVESLNPSSFRYDVGHQTGLATSVGIWMVPLLLLILALLLCCLFCRRDILQHPAPQPPPKEHMMERGTPVEILHVPAPAPVPVMHYEQLPVVTSYDQPIQMGNLPITYESGVPLHFDPIFHNSSQVMMPISQYRQQTSLQQQPNQQGGNTVNVASF